MKLAEFNDDDLKKLIQQLGNTSKNNVDPHKRWEAAQKLKLAQAELHKRESSGGILYKLRRLFNRGK